MEPQELLSHAGWDELHDQEPDDAWTYLQTTIDLVAHVENIVSTKENFEELKAEILNFIKERRTFIEYAYTH